MFSRESNQSQVLGHHDININIMKSRLKSPGSTSGKDCAC